MATENPDNLDGILRPAFGRQPELPGRTDASEVDLSIPELYLNRELSWLAFNERVLDQARDPSHPLLERLKFLAIVGSNLDEFFMVRIATLTRKLAAGFNDVSADGRTVAQQLEEANARARVLLEDQTRYWSSDLRPLLAREGIHFLDPLKYTTAAAAFLGRYFDKEIFPVLTPLAFDPGHPFPHISNLSKNLAVVVRLGGRTRFARIKIPDVLPRFIRLPQELYPEATAVFAFVEDVIKGNLSALFRDVPVRSAHLFRVIRDTDMVIDEDSSSDLLETVDRSLKKLRHGALSLLQVEAGMPKRVLDILVDNFEVSENIVVRTAERLGLRDWMSLSRLPMPRLKDAPYTPRTLWGPADTEGIFDLIKYQDHLVHHPFDSFRSVEQFVEAAVRDPHVVAIKMTLYRIGTDSPLIDLLIEAAEAGKQVAVLVELKARFDERNNIIWAHRLEEAGIHVVYGLVNLKTHCKLCLVVRHEAEGVRSYAHIGTGNYNGVTSQIYTDIGLFTANAGIVGDVSELFNYLTGYSQSRTYHHLLVAPVALRASLLALIDREVEHARAGRKGRIVIKNNAITDPGIITALYRASRAGVTIDLVIRGVCCLRPGVAGVSENISVRSILGRFLEHSRIYYFENGGRPDVFIGSADLMERNLDRRVEALCPIRDPRLQHYLRDVVLDTVLNDSDRATALAPDGVYRRVSTGSGFSAQDALIQFHSNRTRAEDS
jgi:polyphosphate kinase